MSNVSNCHIDKDQNVSDVPQPNMSTIEETYTFSA